MELDLQFEVYNGYAVMLDTTICQEETHEAIVPDACPDILRILDTRAQCCLTGKLARDGLVTVNGQIRACVYYLPDGGEGMKHLEINLPFSCQAEGAGISADAVVTAFPRVCWAETRMLNPRKVLLRVDLAVEVKAYHNRQLGICCSALDDQNRGIKQLQRQEQVDFIASVQEKPFTFSDSLELFSTGAGRGEVMGIWGVPFCSEYKLIGSKLIFKGTVEIEALVWDDERLNCVRHSMAFSQVLEIGGAGEQCSVEIRVLLTDLVSDIESSLSGDGEVTLELLAQAVVYDRKTVTYLADIYSTAYQMEVSSQACPLECCTEHSAKSVSLRELVDTNTPVRAVIYAWMDCGHMQMIREGEQFVPSMQVQLNVLYLDDAQQLQSVHTTFPVSARVDGAAVGICRCWCSEPKEVYVSSVSGGLEVRFTLEFCGIVMENRPVNMVTSAVLKEERKRGEGECPSMILRLASQGERLWDIAKCYGTTNEEIIQANELESDILPYGKMLLIPKAR